MDEQWSGCLKRAPEKRSHSLVQCRVTADELPPYAPLSTLALWPLAGCYQAPRPRCHLQLDPRGAFRESVQYDSPKQWFFFKVLTKAPGILTKRFSHVHVLRSRKRCIRAIALAAGAFGHGSRDHTPPMWGQPDEFSSFALKSWGPFLYRPHP